MLLLRRLIFAPLLACRFSVSIPPRPASVPTQSKTLMPFKVGFLHDNPGARRKPKRLGRGPASGKGKTSGRGIKGHNCRQGGGVHVRFEGGQTPITQRLPKYGRTLRKGDRQILEIVNLGVLDYYVKRGILDPSKVITIRTLLEVGIIKKSKFGVKLLCKGAERVNYALNMEVTDASGAAIQRIKQFGGSVKLIFRTPLKLRQHMYPHKFPLPLRQPIPPSWRVRKLERKEERRGVKIEFRKPKWVIARDLESPTPTNSFVYPVPKVVDSGKIHKRRVKLFKTIKYNLP